MSTDQPPNATPLLHAMELRGLLKAIDFVNKVRQRFRHEEAQEGVYKCFLDVLNSCRLGILDIEGARAQGAALFEKYPDLLDEFFFFAVKRVTPSYTNYSQLTTPNQEDDHVLNDTLKICKNLNGICSSRGRIKSEEERVRDDYEDSRFEMDMLLAWVTSATEAAEKLMNEINGGYNSENPIRIEEHLSAMNLRFIQKLYGEEGINIVEILKENPRGALPVIVPRLRQKLEEIKEWSTSFPFNKYSQVIQFNNYFS